MRQGLGQGLEAGSFFEQQNASCDRLGPFQWTLGTQGLLDVLCAFRDLPTIYKLAVHTNYRLDVYTNYRLDVSRAVGDVAF